MVELGRKFMWLLILVLCCAGLVAAQDTRAIVSESEIDAPVEEVWKAFTTKEGIESWMVPVAEIDLRIGGAMRTNYNPQGKIGDASTITNTIISYDPLRMLSIKATGAPASFPFKKALENMWTVIYFEPIATNRTRVRVISQGFGNDEESNAMREFFKKGNAYTVDKLKERFARRPAQ